MWKNVIFGCGHILVIFNRFPFQDPLRLFTCDRGHILEDKTAEIHFVSICSMLTKYYLYKMPVLFGLIVEVLIIIIIIIIIIADINTSRQATWLLALDGKLADATRRYSCTCYQSILHNKYDYHSPLSLRPETRLVKFQACFQRDSNKWQPW